MSLMSRNSRRENREDLPRLRTLQYLAEYSPRHATALRGLNAERAETRRRDRHMEWCGHVLGAGPECPTAGRTARDDDWGSLLPENHPLLEWDADEHPRAPKGQQDGGQWVAKKGGIRGRDDWDGDAATFTLNAKSGHPRLESPRGGRWVIRRNSIGLDGGFDPGGVLFVPDGKKVTLRKKTSAGTRAGFEPNPLPPEFVEAALGHHYIALAAAMGAGIAERLSKKARAYIIGATSGPTNPAHGNKSFGQISHHRYSKEVDKEFRKFINLKLGAGGRRKLNEHQVAEFDDLLRSGKGANGRENEIIFKYNKGLQKVIIGGYKPRPSVQDVVKKGFAIGKQQRYRDFLKGAVILVALNELLPRQAGAGEIIAKSRHLPDALNALERGDLVEAERLLVGQNDSLYMELLAAKGANLMSGNVASAFYLAVRKLFSDPGLGGFLHDFDRPVDDDED